MGLVISKLRGFFCGVTPHFTNTTNDKFSFLGDRVSLHCDGLPMFVRSFDTKSASRISRKPFDLESPYFMGTSTLTLSTAIPDMTSLSTSGRKLKEKNSLFDCLRRLLEEFLKNGSN